MVLGPLACIAAALRPLACLVAALAPLAWLKVQLSYFFSMDINSWHILRLTMFLEFEILLFNMPKKNLYTLGVKNFYAFLLNKIL